jgi:hypothetical protein
MSGYAPSVSEAVEDEANHQLAYGSRAGSDAAVDPNYAQGFDEDAAQTVFCDDITRVAIFEGDVSPLATEQGVILNEKHGSVFVESASNHANHVTTVIKDMGDNLEMPKVKHDANGSAIMIGSRDENDIVRSVTLSEIENDTGMDLTVNLLNIKTAGNSLYAGASQNLSTIVKKNVDPNMSKVIYQPDLDEELLGFMAKFPNSTAKSIVNDVAYDPQSNMASVFKNSPIVHFYDSHKKDGELVNIPSSALAHGFHFDREVVQMSKDTAKAYLARTQAILNRIIAHSDVCSSRFSIQVKQLQSRFKKPVEKGTQGRLSFNVTVEYFNTKTYD